MARRFRRHPETTLAKAFGQIRADYNAAKITRFRKRLTGVASRGSGADYHYRSEADHLRMMELARSFDRNDMVVGQGITRLIRNVLQGGIRLNPETGNEDLDKDLARRWRLWSAAPMQCHKAGKFSVHTMAKLTLRHMIVDGDICNLPLIEGSLDQAEAHRLRTPTNTKRNVVHGVLLDNHRKPLEYWFTADDLDPNTPLARVSDVKTYPAHDEDGNPQVFHAYLPKRFSQTRGVTALAPIVDPVGMHDDIQFAKLVQQQIASCFAIFHQIAEDAEGAADEPQRGERETETLSDGSTRTIEGIAPGMEIYGEPGETLTGFSPNVPNPEFFSHATLILTFIAINLDLPLAVLLLDPSKTNFSGWRGAIDQARMGFRDLQTVMIDHFYQPVYLWKVRQWLAEDAGLRQAAGGGDVDIFGHKWRPPSWSYIEPNKDAQGDTTITRSGLDSRRGVLARRGLDIEDVDRETIDDNKRRIVMAIEASDEINGKHPGAQVDWRELLPDFAGKMGKTVAKPPTEK